MLWFRSAVPALGVWFISSIWRNEPNKKITLIFGVRGVALCIRVWIIRPSTVCQSFSIFPVPALTCRLARSRSIRRTLQRPSWQHRGGTRTSKGPRIAVMRCVLRPLQPTDVHCTVTREYCPRLQKDLKRMEWQYLELSWMILCLSKLRSTTGSRTSQKRQAKQWRRLCSIMGGHREVRWVDVSSGGNGLMNPHRNHRWFLQHL